MKQLQPLNQHESMEHSYSQLSHSLLGTQHQQLPRLGSVNKTQLQSTSGLLALSDLGHSGFEHQSPFNNRQEVTHAVFANSGDQSPSVTGTQVLNPEANFFHQHLQQQDNLFDLQQRSQNSH